MSRIHNMHREPQGEWRHPVLSLPTDRSKPDASDCFLIASQGLIIISNLRTNIRPFFLPLAGVWGHPNIILPRGLTEHSSGGICNFFMAPYIFPAPKTSV